MLYEVITVLVAAQGLRERAHGGCVRLEVPVGPSRADRALLGVRDALDIRARGLSYNFV